MAVELLTPFTQVPRRSLAQGSTPLLTGRWAVQDANGQAVAPGSGEREGLYLVLEGELLHIGDNTEFDGTTPYDSTNSVSHPSVQASNEAALAYGVFRYRVGPEGFNPAAGLGVGDLAGVDAAGRLDAIGGAPLDVAICRVEGVTSDGNGHTELVLRTLGK